MAIPRCAATATLISSSASGTFAAPPNSCWQRDTMRQFPSPQSTPEKFPASIFSPGRIRNCSSNFTTILRFAFSAKEVEAGRMLHLGLGLSATLLKLRLPDELLAKITSDRATARLAAQVIKWLPAAGYAPPGLFERAAFRIRMHGGLVSSP